MAILHEWDISLPSQPGALGDDSMSVSARRRRKRDTYISRIGISSLLEYLCDRFSRSSIASSSLFKISTCDPNTLAWRILPGANNVQSFTKIGNSGCIDSLLYLAAHSR